jgi:hypothetical protein
LCSGRSSRCRLCSGRSSRCRSCPRLWRPTRPQWLRRLQSNKQVRIFRLSLGRMESRVARFFLVQHTKTGKIYQTTRKYTTGP